ncbi:hypothetical protein BJ508DRAFT_308257 [Ascobolus immersus RN42]|uniref:Uncharacterized protein n=1 Tax=Ascobolus immersus RN42 TaxID=1160509 RepID=A0A3N4I229_ASCIM|nr:hypothetical protein BJ508DRAFT_308257 [Ascobolus immersus RN42]
MRRPGPYNPKCHWCEFESENYDEKEHHRLFKHFAALYDPYKSASKQNTPRIVVMRSADLNFYCAVEGCDMVGRDHSRFGTHCDQAHPEKTLVFKALRCLTVEEKDKLAQKGKDMELCYQNIVANTLVETSEADDINLEKAQSNVEDRIQQAARQPKLNKRSNKVGVVADRAANSKRSSLNEIKGTSSKSVKRKWELSDNIDDMKEMLQAQYRKALFGEMITTMGNTEGDYGASEQRKERLKAYFERSMAMLNDSGDSTS